MNRLYSIAVSVFALFYANSYANAASFDCAKASTVVEGSICANTALSALDEQLAAAYGRARSSAPNADAIRTEQLEWLKRRNNCGANVECLTNSYRSRIATLLPSTIAPANSGIQSLNGNWYSAQWKYGYTLQNGVGTATSTNSPNFQVGQNIIQLTATAPNKFSGQQVYTDGKFYKVTATLQPDGTLFFEGEKNVKWTMTRVGRQPSVAPASGTDDYNDGASAYRAKDYATALRILSPLANRNDARAQNLLGIMFANGYGVEKDPVRAFEWYKLAATHGNSAGQFNLGMAYKLGKGVQQNFSESVKWLLLVAPKGHYLAQFELGQMYQLGQGVPVNEAEALTWYTLAASHGYAAAIKNKDVLVSRLNAEAPPPSKPSSSDTPVKPATQNAAISSENLTTDAAYFRTLTAATQYAKTLVAKSAAFRNALQQNFYPDDYGKCSIGFLRIGVDHVRNKRHDERVIAIEAIHYESMQFLKGIWIGQGFPSSYFDQDIALYSRGIRPRTDADITDCGVKIRPALETISTK